MLSYVTYENVREKIQGVFIVNDSYTIVYREH